MFKLNLLSGTIWVLGGVLLFIAIILIFWRILTRKKTRTNQSSKNIGSVTKEFNEFIISLSASTNFDIIHNVLIKNKYAKNNFSIIPAIIFANGKSFLLTNAISSRKYNEIHFKENEIYPLYIKGDKKIQVTNLSKLWTQEIIKYLSHKFNKINFNIVTPIIDDSINIAESWSNWNYFSAIEFEDEIMNFEDNKKISNSDIKKIANHLKANNLFKSGVSSDQKNIVHKRRF